MGERVTAADLGFDGADRARFRSRLGTCQQVLERMLAEDRFEKGRKLCGLELELVLIDAHGDPAMVNNEVLGQIASPDFQTELGQFNLEVNIAPHKLVGAVFSELAEELRTALLYADRVAGGCGAHVAMIGILPTLGVAHMVRENFSADDRYVLLNDQLASVRGEDFHLRIDGPEPLDASFATILPEACCTSVQLHLQVTPEGFAPAWNAAQAIAAPQVALGANSPFLFGRRLWHETRIALFEQATDSRPQELAAQGVRPRVWFGERWIHSPAQLFRENLTYFTALLPRVGAEDPQRALESGRVPHLQELRLHNGTVYRWNRPVYDVARGKPHLRVENRVLPAGPTVLDVLANAAFYYGLVRALADADGPVWRRLSFAAARENLRAAARDGIGARLHWPGRGQSGAADLVLGELLPLAAAGLERWRIDPRERDLYLGIIEARARTRRNGAVWQIEQVEHLERRGMSRGRALAAMVPRYAELARAGDPVHTWPVG
ncbi:glutamate--cysteine ligase [Actinocrinis puniceicyclus]|uniref:Glutamate--cysteine ligase n=1 Tax=Actinocrinis puniceicyclus TaxID=977794 RepID=A0A8J7WUC6_9ACTN|nr:glutamate--cysteine ligase [Actinocrinis puniceicyclus]MBS2966299.1 glutamate--cysteine ligase [Actinocrinis puniceicyclus]